jgi:hypothetical protein
MGEWGLWRHFSPPKGDSGTPNFSEYGIREEVSSSGESCGGNCGESDPLHWEGWEANCGWICENVGDSNRFSGSASLGIFTSSEEQEEELL